MQPRKRRRLSESKPGKNSFCASPESTMQNRIAVKGAMDESLSSVHFNAQDMRSVLRAVHGGKKRAAARKKRHGFKPDVIFALSLMLMLALPLSLFSLRSKNDITTIVISPGKTTAQPAAAQPGTDIVSLPPAALPTAAPTNEAVQTDASLISENEAIRIARECFETHCNTSIFAFEEYEVSVMLSEGDAPQYCVTLESIYKNGCSFTVVICAKEGAVLQYSAPQLATVPACFDSTSPEVRAWYDKYGEHLFTWPHDVQAEFSRRYQGGTLRTARDGEISFEDALAAACTAAEREAPGQFEAFYPVLYSEQSSDKGRAYYVVYCYAHEITDSLPESEPMIVSFDAATGDILSVENNPLKDALGIKTLLKTP